MADSTRQPAADGDAAAGAGDRERSIESLLVAGLDLYFAGEYERAIHAWTRVLFYDRSHARARAYIERARRVLAERQRETDELLHRGLVALDGGDIEGARRLLSSAVRRGGAVEAAEAALDRLDRLAKAGATEPPRVAASARAPDVADARPGGPPSRLLGRALAVGLALVALVVAAYLALQGRGFEAWGRAEPAPGSVVPARTDAPLPRPNVADVALQRARALFARGHLHEALAALNAVPADGDRRAELDRLRAEVQGALLADFDGANAQTAPPRASRP